MYAACGIIRTIVLRRPRKKMTATTTVTVTGIPWRRTHARHRRRRHREHRWLRRLAGSYSRRRIDVGITSTSTSQSCYSYYYRTIIKSWILNMNGNHVVERWFTGFVSLANDAFLELVQMWSIRSNAVNKRNESLGRLDDRNGLVCVHFVMRKMCQRMILRFFWTVFNNGLINIRTLTQLIPLVSYYKNYWNIRMILVIQIQYTFFQNCFPDIFPIRLG